LSFRTMLIDFSSLFAVMSEERIKTPFIISN
jgi:hypothetical protein